ncbi:ApeA N-terminal domain 1-containing protein [Catellatospora vulcania]|uniref:ApeA N-terminal domain 1-containing protein n=1 Tax=Catellatospora vulcania TaxID=1460450 RepID=UPI0012D3CE53|nr:hypothetical protein [Catellatospora vulcania]
MASASQVSRGVWWLPGNRGYDFIGTLAAGDDGECTLESDSVVAEGWFGSGLTVDENGLARIAAIHGMVDDERITILDCVTFAYVPGLSKVSISGHGVVERTWVAGIDDKVFDELLLDIDNLGHFTDSRTQLTLGDYPDPVGPRRPVLFYEPVEAVVGDFRVSLQWRRGAGVEHGTGSKRVYFEEFVNLRIRTDKPTRAAVHARTVCRYPSVAPGHGNRADVPSIELSRA